MPKAQQCMQDDAPDGKKTQTDGARCHRAIQACQEEGVVQFIDVVNGCDVHMSDVAFITAIWFSKKRTNNMDTPVDDASSSMVPPKIKKQKSRTPKQCYRIPRRAFHMGYFFSCKKVLRLQRLVRELLYELRPTRGLVRLDPKCSRAIQEATEGYVQQLLEDSSKCALHAKRITLLSNDILLACSLRGRPY